MSLVAELQRRSVFKVGAAYLVVAWLTIQAASIMFPTFEAPAWALRVFIFVLMLGFFVAAIGLVRAQASVTVTSGAAASVVPAVAGGAEVDDVDVSLLLPQAVTATPRATASRAAVQQRIVRVMAARKKIVEDAVEPADVDDTDRGPEI